MKKLLFQEEKSKRRKRVNDSRQSLRGARTAKGHTDKNRDKVLKVLFHDIQNNLQAIRMEMDLLKLESCSGVDFRRMLHSIERANLSIQDLSDYLTPPQLYFSEEKAEIILEEIIDEFKRAVIQQGIDVRLIRSDTLPVISVDCKQFRSALERVLKFCQALLKDGGDLEIEANLKRLEGRKNVEVRLITSARNPIDLEEGEVFRPFLRVNGYKLGLGMVVAREVLRRHHGTIFFQKVPPNRGVFTITLQGLLENKGLH